jgi:ABC-type nitrate/sulfonate/bicarbonate transport system substrate-binding protein
MKTKLTLLTLVCLAGLAPMASLAKAETFSIAASEYPSWSVFIVAGLTKVGGEPMINIKAGRMGIIEKKWGVDLEVRYPDYEGCLMQYGNGQCDFVCITNMDILSPALTLDSVAILPTSTSFGADACIVTKKVKTLKDLQQHPVRGLSMSVSEYCFVRNIELRGAKEKAYRFVNMDPGMAAAAMQQKQSGHNAIVVWNPFVLSTLEKLDGSRVLFDSTSIPGEIIDMVVANKKSLAKPKGKEAACAIIDTFYQVCGLMASPETQDKSLFDLGKKFADLNVAQMKQVVRQTRFYATPKMGIHLFQGGVVFPWARKAKSTTTLFTDAGFDPKNKTVSDKSLKEIMPLVVDFCLNKEIVEEKPSIGYGPAKNTKAQLCFDASYMKAVQGK